MVFLSICTALYDYAPQGEGELEIHEGELVYIIEKSTEDDWWRAKKRAPGQEDEEPSGLIPNNYVEEATPTHHAKALYDYDRQTDEELSFPEDAVISVYDTSDPDWTLVGLNGEYGFAPANYIEINAKAEETSPQPVTSPALPERVTEQEAERELPPTPRSNESTPQSPAAAIAGILHGQSSRTPSSIQQQASIDRSLPQSRLQYTPDASDEEPPTPPLPLRPASQQISPPPTQYASPRSPEPPGVVASPPNNRQHFNDTNGQLSPGGFHLYNINEMVSAMGKRKKMPTTLGLNLATGNIMIAPEKSRDGPQQEWTAEKLTHYSIEGKHVFMELVRPSKSIDFHAGAKDTAEEIVSALGEMAGASRAEGLREVIAAGSGSKSQQRKGQILYDFMAQGDDEVTVAVGDEVIVVDDSKSEEWWMVRRLKNGQEGVVPSSYVEITGVASAPPSSTAGVNASRSTTEQNRIEEERLAKEAIQASKKRGGNDAKGSEVGPGMKLPQRGSSLMGGHDSNNGSSQRNKRDSRSDGKSSSGSKPKPDSSKTRTWTDRSGSFKVEAEFLGLKDGKIHLHKLNGVKIAVPVSKMAVGDLEYVERATGVSLDEEKPLSNIRRKSQRVPNGSEKKTAQPSSPSASKSGASIQKPPEYDWFDFFLKCGVSPYQCERYAFNFNKDSMDESSLPDIEPSILRNLGLKEGDIIRVMKFLDNKFNRTGAKSKLRNVSYGNDETNATQDGGPSSPGASGGGLFSGPGGMLRNNTRKGRPAPTVQINDTVDPKAFQQKNSEDRGKAEGPDITSPQSASPPTSKFAKRPPSGSAGGFDDDAWDVKPSKQQSSTSPAPSSAPTPSAPSAPQPALTGSMAELSLLSAPLQPTVAHNTGSQQVPQALPNQPNSVQQQPQQPTQQQPPQQPIPQQSSLQTTQQQPIQQQPTGANPSFFSQLNQQSMGSQFQQNNIPQSSLGPQQTGFGQLQSQQNMPPRQRPHAPPSVQQGSLVPPPPRPFSAPLNPAQSGFGPPPLQPQLTGLQTQGANQNQTVQTGPSLNDMNQMRLQQQQQQFNQQQQQQLQTQPTGFGQFNQPYNQFGNGIMPQPTGYIQQPSFQPQRTGFQPQQPFMNGQQTGSPFADPRPPQQSGGYQPMPSQPTGFQSGFQSSFQPQQTGSINSMLAPALQPQQTGINGFNNMSGFGQSPPPVPPIPQQPTVLVPLQPQKTGPAPSISFGVNPEAKKLTPQPTGRKANLSQATPQNPFGF